jgi:hypothetical protein
VTFAGWILTWPDAKAASAELTRRGAIFMPGAWQLDGQAVGQHIANTGDSTSIAQLAPGRHSLSGTCSKAGASMTITAVFPAPNGKIKLEGRASTEAFSHKISDLCVPACAAYSRK